MTVSELKELLIGVDDDMQVVIPTNSIFDGVFYTPDYTESGVNLFGEDTDPNEELFLLAPTGFSDDEIKTHELN